MKLLKENYWRNNKSQICASLGHIELGSIEEAKEKINIIRSRAGITTLDDADITIERVRH